MLSSLLCVDAALGRCQEGTDSAALQYKYRFFWKLAWLLVFACMNCLCLSCENPSATFLSCFQNQKLTEGRFAVASFSSSFHAFWHRLMCSQEFQMLTLLFSMRRIYRNLHLDGCGLKTASVELEP